MSDSSATSLSATNSSPASATSSPCTTPELLAQPKSETIVHPKTEPTPVFTIPPLDDPEDYTIPSLAWQYIRIVSALEHFNCTAPSVLAEFKDLASELASRAAGRSHNPPRMPARPEKATLSHIRALARYRMRVAPGASFKAWKDKEEIIERVLGYYRDLARSALAAADRDGCCGSPEVLTPSARDKKRPLDDVEAQFGEESAVTPHQKIKRLRIDHSAAQGGPRRSSRKSVTPRRFGATD